MKVVRRGNATGKTHEILQCLTAKGVFKIEPRDNRFSDEGDSGSLVFVKEDNLLFHLGFTMLPNEITHL